MCVCVYIHIYRAAERDTQVPRCAVLVLVVWLQDANLSEARWVALTILYEKELSQNFAGNEVYYAIFLILLVNNTLCSKDHR